MVKIITDYGYCYGVEHAISLLSSVQKEKKRPLLLHPLIHNLLENERLMKESGASYYADRPEEDDVLVFSAHGHTLKEEASLPSSLETIDATCPLILSRYKILSKREEGTTYFFLGKKNHEETNGFLSHFPFLVFLDSSLPLWPSLSQHTIKKAFLVPQTTVSEKKKEEAICYFEKNHIPYDSFPICPLYQRRAKQAVSFFREHPDISKACFIVVGDTLSSNANEILNTVQDAFPSLRGQIALKKEDIKGEYLTSDFYLASSTSVSKTTVENLFSDLQKCSP